MEKPCLFFDSSLWVAILRSVGELTTAIFLQTLNDMKTENGTVVITKARASDSATGTSIAKLESCCEKPAKQVGPVVCNVKAIWSVTYISSSTQVGNTGHLADA